MNDRPTIVVLGFDTTYEYNHETGKKDRAVEWCSYAPAHSALFSLNRERLDFLNPEKMKVRADDDNGAKKQDFMRHRWAMIEKAYRAWKEGHEIPVDGTPLAAWPGLNNAQAGVFRALGIKSVEQIAEMNDSLMGRVQLPGVREIQNQAKAFLEASDRNSTANRLTELEGQNKELLERLDATMALLEEKTAPPRRRQAREVAEEAEAA